MVGLVVPRKAFLALVALNVRGLAKSLSVFSDAELKKIWVKKFGGELKTLKNTIKKGKNRKALLGASKRVKAIKGIGYVVDDSKGIGLAGEEIAAIVAAAAPILAVVIAAIVNKTKGKKAVKKKPAFKILLTEEQKKTKQLTKIEGRNIKVADETLLFFKGKKIAMNEEKEKQIQKRTLDTKIRIFLYSITYNPKGEYLETSDDEYLNKINIFVKRENSDNITKIFREILDTIYETKYIKVLLYFNL